MKNKQLSKIRIEESETHMKARAQQAKEEAEASLGLLQEFDNEIKNTLDGLSKIMLDFCRDPEIQRYNYGHIKTFTDLYPEVVESLEFIRGELTQNIVSYGLVRDILKEDVLQDFDWEH